MPQSDLHPTSPTRILSIGEAMVEISRAPDPDLWRMGFAGDTLNTAWYLRRLLSNSWEVSYLTRVGTGDFSNRMVDFLQAEGLDTTHVTRQTDAEVGLYAISLTNGERSFSYWRDNSAARRLADDPALLDAALQGCAMAYLSGITLAILPQQGRDNLLQALDRARQGGTTVVFDTNLRPRLWSDADTMRTVTQDAASRADLVLPSFDDEAALFGDTDPQATLSRYLTLGAVQVVVKNGGGPILFGGRDGEGCIDDLSVDTPVDSTSAGDSFNAGYLAARLTGRDCVGAIRAGHALGRQVIRHPGALIRQAVTDAHR